MKNCVLNIICTVVILQRVNVKPFMITRKIKEKSKPPEHSMGYFKRCHRYYVPYIHTVQIYA